MNLNIQTVHFTADEKLINYVTKKIQKLDTFHDRIIKVDVFLKLDNVVHNIKDKVSEIRIVVPKKSFFVKATFYSFTKKCLYFILYYVICQACKQKNDEYKNKL